MRALEAIRKSEGEITRQNITDLDSLVFSYLAGIDGIDGYLKAEKLATLGDIIELHSLERLNERDRLLLEAINDSPRYRSLRVIDLYREQSNPDDRYSTLVRANLYRLSDETLVLAFSGTPGDIDSIIEELKMRYLPQEVRAFEVAKGILRSVLEEYPQFLFLSGITRGASLALVALIETLKDNESLPILGARFYGSLPYEALFEDSLSAKESLKALDSVNKKVETSAVEDYLTNGKDVSFLSVMFSKDRDELNWEFEDGTISNGFSV